MKSVTLKDLETQEVKEVETNASLFMWEEGNYACDCNRSIFFYGLDVDKAFPCGEKRFEMVGFKK